MHTVHVLENSVSCALASAEDMKLNQNVFKQEFGVSVMYLRTCM